MHGVRQAGPCKLAIGGEFDTLGVYDVETRKLELQLPVDDVVYEIALSPEALRFSTPPNLNPNPTLTLTLTLTLRLTRTRPSAKPERRPRPRAAVGRRPRRARTGQRRPRRRARRRAEAGR